ncbi:SirB1 family protein [Pararobbsia silviterrae]|uniref:Transglutaminase n=1 Tax=Pararobbsia silviterrae TaxID=1792498 RepID=A0A494XM86_9BURK|nr:tetratricopeptide repeat protein [Pararobbsia silviterrae]RKP48653.1 transglutaminase [Pararobbsia silviterrae]
MATRLLEYFGTLVAEDVGFPLTEAALAIAQDAYPDLDLQGCLATIDEFALRVRKRIAADAGITQKLQTLNRFFFGELGFGANLNDYNDPDNSHLNIVIQRRRGVPTSLAVLYLEISSQLGIPARGVSFPGHFLLRVTTPAGEIMLDPTTGEALSESRLVDMLEPYVRQHSGESISSVLRTLLMPATDREIVAKMLRTLKSLYIQTERWQRLLAIQQRLVVLLPERIEERRDRGFAFARLDFFRPAVEDLERYLELRPDADDATVIESQLEELRQRTRGGDDEAL